MIIIEPDGSFRRESTTQAEEEAAAEVEERDQTRRDPLDWLLDVVRALLPR